MQIKMLTIEDIPGVVYPSPLPKTSRELVDRLERDSGQSQAIKTFFSKQRTPQEVLSYIKKWADLAWNTRVTFEQETENLSSLFRTRMGILTFRFKRQQLVEHFEMFLRRWKDDLKDQRRRWDQRFAAKIALENFLRGSNTVTAEAMLEAERQVASYADLVRQMLEGAYQHKERLKALETQYDVSETGIIALFSDLGASIDTALKAVGEALAVVVKTAAEDVLAPVLGPVLKALPWYVWAGLGFIGFLYIRPFLPKRGI